METTSMLISVRFLSLPNRSNQIIPIRDGKSAAIIMATKVIEHILNMSLVFKREKKSVLMSVLELIMIKDSVSVVTNFFEVAEQ
jgi:hypothetical protein